MHTVTQGWLLFGHTGTASSQKGGVLPSRANTPKCGGGLVAHGCSASTSQLRLKFSPVCPECQRHSGWPQHYRKVSKFPSRHHEQTPKSPTPRRAQANRSSFCQQSQSRGFKPWRVLSHDGVRGHTPKCPARQKLRSPVGETLDCEAAAPGLTGQPGIVPQPELGQTTAPLEASTSKSAASFTLLPQAEEISCPPDSTTRNLTAANTTSCAAASH